MAHKFIDLGIKRKEEFGGEPFDSKKHQNEKVFPSFRIHNNVPKEMFKFDPDTDFRAEVILRVKSKEVNESPERKRTEMSLQVKSIKVLGKNKMTKNEFKNASDEDRDAENTRVLNV